MKLTVNGEALELDAIRTLIEEAVRLADMVEGMAQVDYSPHATATQGIRKALADVGR